MRILFSLTYYSPYISGLTNYLRNLAEELAARSHQCRVLCMKHDASLPVYETINGVGIIRAVPLFKVSKGFLSLDFAVKSVKSVRESERIVIGLPQAEGFLPAILGKVFRKKVTAIYLCDVVLPQGILNKIATVILDVCNLVTLSLADKVVTYGADYADSSRLLPHFRKKLVYIYPPVRKPQRSTGTAKYGRKGKLLIGMAGRMAEEKGVEYLLEALNAIDPRTEVLIAGPTEPAGEQAYKERVTKAVRRAGRKVKVAGVIPEGEMGDFYSCLKILALPSVNATEAFGMVQVEAMMCGVPVVASDLPGVRLPIRETGMGITVPPKNPAALAEAINEILNNYDSYRMGKVKAEEVFDLKKIIDRFEKIITG
ncbi:hypothetical protein A2701_02180 [Candidatus Amesbacteria bacterium RIFCSPHIGHO2_01_FULL_47_34]|uniref:Glycosyl transferase family 1 domain-containing protein n=1 Tax=Candidatus Amesbacteria bacterium RIFCSPLOWO2_01_FULL_47_33 TaxID=1797258 RepID=A0A1F4Z904_9BACT|nr:MAG: hypothetical protein A2701_02180 [Candidatus Amesbacteria bacterium RIFCSPHIGHO2_01_FULL_47_34]OGD01914.1 MAG: hypothetical protein A2972_02175 [Candidatus Amesbacteria bacterium RIFCSPLOWO2_01_FULL_47_33]